MKDSARKSSTGNRGQPGSPAAKQVFIVDDHPVFREGLVQILDRAGNGLRVCGEAGDAESALEAIRRLNPDVAVVDLSLPGMSGLELIKELRVDNHKIKLLVVSMHDEALYADRVLRAGGDGYIMKQEDPEEILTAIYDVLAERIYVSEQVLVGAGHTRSAEPDRSQVSSSRIDELNDTELLILEHLGQGKSEGEIAREVNLNASAVGAHCRDIAKKLNLKTTNALIRYAVCWVEQGKT